MMDASERERLVADFAHDIGPLRMSLIRACNATDGGCTNTVSNDFLSRVGKEVELCIASLRADKAQLTARVSALEADAARYRWLRDHIHYRRDDDHAYPYATVRVYLSRDDKSINRMTAWPRDGVGAASLDTAIDAALHPDTCTPRPGECPEED
jgi:hypothetical protein